MKIFPNPGRCAALLAVCQVLTVPATTMAQTPSQKPLLSRDGGGVKPNIVLTLDDSGSMRFQHMPEGTVRVGSFSVDNPVQDNSVRMDPGDPNNDASQSVLPAFFLGTVAAEAGSSNYRQRLMRSPETNTIYYNPEVRYRPWLKADGTRYADAVPATARLSPTDSSVGTVDLTNVRNVNTRWCFRASTDDCQDEGQSTSRSYSPGLYYRLRKDGSGNFLSPTNAANYTEFNINAGTASSTFTKYAARTDCTGSSCTRDQERRNFANWFTYYRSRMLLTKASVSEAFATSTDAYRIGYGRINKTTTSTVDGVASLRTLISGVRDFNATQKASLYTWLHDLEATGGTPLRRALQDVGAYYSSSSSAGPWSDTPGSTTTAAQKTCRRAYNILLTDGYWNDTVGSNGLTATGNQDNTDGTTITGVATKTEPAPTYKYTASRPYRDTNSDQLADYAMRYWKQDLRADLDNKVVASSDNPAFWQHMVNFTVGLGVTGTLNPDTDLPALTSGVKTWGTDKIDDLWHTALNSRGQFFSAKDPTELASAISSSIGRALERPLSESGAATASSTLETGNRKYVPSYATGSWTGDVKAFKLNENGVAGEMTWSAKIKLPVWGDRKIFTWNPDASAAIPFTWASMSTAMRTAMGSVATTHTNTFVDYLRGDKTNEDTDDPFRKRSSLLGDFVNSNPVLIKGNLNMDYARLPTGGSAYPAFRTDKAGRAGTLFVGANDGMLHAFRDNAGSTVADDDGKEVFAYVPRAVYANLSKLSDKQYGTTNSDLFHQFFVDGPLKEADAFVRAPGTAAGAAATWRNYLLGSLGAGGRAVYALDVTDTTNLGASNVMWEFSSSNDADMGHVQSPIETGVLPNGQWVAVFGNGFASGLGQAVLFVLDLRTGVAQKVVVDATGSNGLGGVAVQRNANGEITALFAGDLKGKLWKFDYSAAAASKFSISGGAAFFTATSSGGIAQPITQPPILYNHAQGGKIVIFGTGQLITEADANSTAVQAMYGVWDKASDTIARPMTRSVLATRTVSEVTGANNSKFYSVTGADVNDTTQRGWVVDLGIITGLRVIYPPLEVNDELVLISAVAPAQNIAACNSDEGVGINFVMPAGSGSNPPYPLFNTNGDDSINSSDIIVSGYGAKADGVDAVISSPARNAVGTAADGPCAPGFYRASFQNSIDQQLGCVKKKVKTGGRDRIWRRILNPPIR